MSITDSDQEIVPLIPISDSKTMTGCNVLLAQRRPSHIRLRDSSIELCSKLHLERWRSDDTTDMILCDLMTNRQYEEHDIDSETTACYLSKTNSSSRRLDTILERVLSSTLDDTNNKVVVNKPKQNPRQSFMLWAKDSSDGKMADADLIDNDLDFANIFHSILACDGTQSGLDSETAVLSVQDNDRNTSPKRCREIYSSETEHSPTFLRSNSIPPGKFTEVDVLLGRGGLVNLHPGNKAYLQHKERMQARYLTATKEEKTEISQELVDIVHGWGGRFMKLKDDGDGEPHDWYEIENVKARKKASQTLREINTAEHRANKRVKYNKSKQTQEASHTV